MSTTRRSFLKGMGVLPALAVPVVDLLSAAAEPLFHDPAVSCERLFNAGVVSAEDYTAYVGFDPAMDTDASLITFREDLSCLRGESELVATVVIHKLDAQGQIVTDVDPIFVLPAAR